VEREDVALMQVTINRPIIERDAELLEALRRRDASAAERLAAMFGDRVDRLAISITGNREDAEEAVQDTFLTVIARSTRFGGRQRSHRGSIVSRQTPPTTNAGAARVDVMRSRSTRSFRASTRTGAMSRAFRETSGDEV
jgi:hypothetical protein